MAFITLTGRLANDPQQRQTRTGTAMTTGFCFAKLGQDSGDLALGIVAFGTVAAELLNYTKGDTVNLAGSLKVNIYEKNGEQVEQLQIVLDGIAGKNQSKQVRGQSKASQPNQAPNQGHGGGYGQQPPPMNQANSGHYGAPQTEYYGQGVSHQYDHQPPAQEQPWQAEQQFQSRQGMPAPSRPQPAAQAQTNTFEDDSIPF